VLNDKIERMVKEVECKNDKTEESSVGRSLSRKWRVGGHGQGSGVKERQVKEVE
jgi:hypothetical protein